MGAEQQQMTHLLEAIEEKTDMMYNAIKVDHFDVFESNLLLRDELFNAYENLKSQMTSEELAQLNVADVFKKIKELNFEIEHELERFHDYLENELVAVKVEKSKLQTNQKKTNQYHLRTDATVSGNYFDKKK